MCTVSGPGRSPKQRLSSAGFERFTSLISQLARFTSLISQLVRQAFEPLAEHSRQR